MMDCFKESNKSWLLGFLVGIEAVICGGLLCEIARIIYQEAAYGSIVVGVDLWRVKFIMSSSAVAFAALLIGYCFALTVFLTEFVKDIKEIKKELRNL